MVAGVVIQAAGVYANEIKFNPRMLGLSGEDAKGVDLDYFSRQNGQAPGIYSVDVYLNQNYVDTRRVNFIADKKNDVRPEFSAAQLKEMGVLLPASVPMADENAPLPQGLETYIPSATTHFSVSTLRLDISVPQVNMTDAPRGSMSSALWDNGITAALLNYSYSGSRTKDLNGGGDSENDFLSIHSGLNIQAWRLRYDGNLTHSSGGNSGDNSDANDSSGTHWDSLNTYLQRSYSFWQGEALTLGQFTTPSDVFDGIQFSGVQLASDDDMLPDSMQNFAPRISGIARSTSLLTIKQNGNTVYQTTVAPGPYAIKDLYSLGRSGDLQVTLRESNGQITQYVVPFNSLPVLQREGRYKFGLTAGKYRSGNNDTETPDFFQGTLSAGLPADFTLYGGTQYADNYTSWSLGVGRNFGVIGALSVDTTHARAEFDTSTQSGYKTREQYQKTFDITDTTLQASLSQYTEDYFTFSDRQDYYSDSGTDSDIFNRSYNKKREINASLTQNTQAWGAFSLSGYLRDYYDTGGQEKNWQASYNNSIAGVSYTLAYSETDTPGSSDNDRRYSLNLSVPLDRFLNSNHMWLNYSMNSTRHGPTSHLAGVSGTALEDNNLSYNVSQGYISGDDDSGASGLASLDYKGRYGEANIGYSYDPDSRQVNYGLQGGMVAHANGLTLSQPMNDTVALVKAPGADDVRVENNSGVRTDWRGYTIVPYVQPYRKNRIYLDSRTFGDNVDMDRNINYVIPTKGAVVLANFATRVGRRALLTLKDAQGNPLPFGAVASAATDGGSTSGIVDEDGTVYLTGLPDSGKMQVKWSDTNSCSSAYNLPAASNAAVTHLSLVCK
ncbi:MULTISPECIES: fimbria/pilus outer membrane usher protein [Enterobacterales]|uniref:fimbria/pilus outer membrane usher protein n=1 Tax=Enterobacterales TaxID=91347 RepID=UPI002ED8E9E6